MVAPGMRRYRVRTAAHETLVGPPGAAPIDPPALFGRVASLRLDVGFGHGEFISQMAAAHPDVDFLGFEHDRLRVTKAAHKCLKEGAGNVRLFQGDALALARRLPPASLQRAYVLFPDPWPKAGHRRRRLMNHEFLSALGAAVAPGGRLVIASDTHNYALQALSNLTLQPGCWRNLYLPAGYRIDIPTRFPTVFERHKKAEGCRICYLMLERLDVRHHAGA